MRAPLLLIILCLPPALSANEVTSPDGSLSIAVGLDEVGRLSYSVSLSGEVVVKPSRLGLRFANGTAFDKGVRLKHSDTSSHDSTWEQPWGERRLVHDRHNRAAFEFVSGDGRTFTLQVRVFDDGIGFRYELPGCGEAVEISDELTEFRLDPGVTAYWQPGSHQDKYEVLYRATPVADIDNAHSPLTLLLESGVHVSIHEAALVDYSAFTLTRTAPGILQTTLRPWSDGVRVRVTTPFVTPWRAIQVTRDAAGLINSDLILNLNEPNRLGDVSWVEPGKYIGVWWEIHLGHSTWSTGPDHGATTANARRYIDFAAEHGFDGVLLEGWNVGWNSDEEYSFLDAAPDLDLESVAAHAEERGVRLIGHHETYGDIPGYEAVMNDAFDLYESLGVRQVKTGYVGLAGSLLRRDEDGRETREWHDSQHAVQHQLRVLEEAAKRQISINTHEPVKDTGLRRTYPNWLSREGARGQEFAVWGQLPNPPEHITMLAFTRMLAGPLDFTPGLFDLDFEARGNQRRVQTTLAKQLALYVVLYSPIHMAPDLLENYEQHLDAFQFIKDVPTDWEESIALAGEVGDYVVIARQERGSNDWYVGAVTDELARELSVPLSFLEPGHSYIATVYRDGDAADWEENPHEFAIEEMGVDADDDMQLKLAAGGGAAIRIRSERE